MALNAQNAFQRIKKFKAALEESVSVDDENSKNLSSEYDQLI
tara:strand:+ start:980 stop:1105 length:126 start_codon:yes stop_codon:yes gene_type:complete